ncbi:MAG: hypothetical protein KBT14_03335 [Proteobacteria bacterium]|nr:hypothetical protein [Candidatus Enterousia onthequi]
MTNTFVTSVFADNEPIACDGVVRNYVSATGTVIQNGTPTPENPIEPIFYTQGDMVLRAVGDYADSYDATTGKITRHVGVKVFDGTENLIIYYDSYIKSDACDVVFKTNYMVNPNRYKRGICSHLLFTATQIWNMAGQANKITFNNPTSGVLDTQIHMNFANSVLGIVDYTTENRDSVIAKAKSYLAQQYANGTPLTVYYPLANEVVEDWSATTYCAEPIKIATTKMVDEEFAAAEAQLAATVQTIESVVSRTIAQTGQIQILQDTKQTRPDESCPANMKCLLVQDEDGTPHWYPIIEP